MDGFNYSYITDKNRDRHVKTGFLYTAPACYGIQPTSMYNTYRYM